MQIEPLDLRRMAALRLKDAGIDNVIVDKDALVMCGIRYVVETCACGDHACDGVRLRRVTPDQLQ